MRRSAHKDAADWSARVGETADAQPRFRSNAGDRLRVSRERAGVGPDARHAADSNSIATGVAGRAAFNGGERNAKQSRHDVNAPLRAGATEYTAGQLGQPVLVPNLDRPDVDLPAPCLERYTVTADPFRPFRFDYTFLGHSRVRGPDSGSC